MPSPTKTKQIVTSQIKSDVLGPILNAGDGLVLYVNGNHTNATDSRTFGRTPDQPLATIDYAIGLCTANRGDVIIAAAGHAESISTAGAIAADNAGISIIGQGNGSIRPTITYTATAATMVVSAANITIKNIRFVSNIDDLAVFLTISANDCTVEGCDFVGASTKEFINAIGITTTYDNATIRGCRFIQPTDPTGTDAAAGTGAIYLVDSENVLIDGCEFRGHFETALVHNKTTAAANLWIQNCWGINSGCAAGTATILELVAGATGGIANCTFNSPLADDVTAAKIIGALPTGGFFVHANCSFGNDGATGGQLAIVGGSESATS